MGKHTGRDPERLHQKVVQNSTVEHLPAKKLGEETTVPIDTPLPPKTHGSESKRDPGLFVGIIFGIITILFFVLQSNGVDKVNWVLSALIYAGCTVAVVWTTLRHAMPEKNGLERYLTALLLAVVCLGLGSIGTVKQYGREHIPTAVTAALQSQPCGLSVQSTSYIVSAVHSRSTWPLASMTGTVYEPIYQDLFHDWEIELIPDPSATDITVLVYDSRDFSDRSQVEPADQAEIFPTEKKWLSGFEEPNQKPDFFVRRFRFPKLTSKATITLRQSIRSSTPTKLKVNSFSLDLDRIIEVKAGNCKIKQAPMPDRETQFSELNKQLKALLERNWGRPGRPPVPTRSNPDDPYPPLKPDEAEMTSDIRCIDPSCKEVTLKLGTPRRAVKVSQ